MEGNVSQRKADHGRIASLDGLRAVSIALVLVGHSLPYSSHGRIGDVANLGVRVFFVISGLLITHLLLREHARQGSISLSRFFGRRALRIMPPLFAFLAVVFVVERLGWLPQSDASSWGRALTYTINYVPAVDRPWQLGHIWSLAVEEQFYLLWPAAIVVFGVRRSLRGALAVILIVPLLRYLTWRYFPEHLTGIKWEFHTVCDALAVGCLFAGIRDQLWDIPGYRRIMQSAWPLVLVPLVLAVNWYVVGRPRVGYLFGITAMNVGIVLVIEYCIRNAAGLVGRVLNARPIVALGIISYSTYLWQQLFFGGSTRQPFPLNLVLTILVAITSYVVLERPLLGWRHKLSRG